MNCGSKRLSKLSDEVFDNVTYFKIVAIGAAVAALALLLIGSETSTPTFAELQSFSKIGLASPRQLLIGPIGLRVHSG